MERSSQCHWDHCHCTAYDKPLRKLREIVLKHGCLNKNIEFKIWIQWTRPNDDAVSKPPPIKQCYCDKEDMKKSWLHKLVENNVDYERQKGHVYARKGSESSCENSNVWFPSCQQCLFTGKTKCCKDLKEGSMKNSRTWKDSQARDPLYSLDICPKHPRYPLKWPVLYIKSWFVSWRTYSNEECLVSNFWEEDEQECLFYNPQTTPIVSCVALEDMNKQNIDQLY